ncbi:hypothetical protein ColKHC_11676 [Colletotrichum higginsianum]|nr:hypothetical protein ColKHC_11676 [Colletotrichum higginsianum]
MAVLKFREFGGGQTTPWGQSDLEEFAVDMGLVEERFVPMPKDPQVKTRRLKKVSSRLRSGAYANAVLQEVAENGGGLFEQNPELHDQVTDEIFEYRGDDAEEEEEDHEAMLDMISQTSSNGSGLGIKTEDDNQSVGTTSGRQHRQDRQAKKGTREAQGAGEAQGTSKAQGAGEAQGTSKAQSQGTSRTKVQDFLRSFANKMMC